MSYINTQLGFFKDRILPDESGCRQTEIAGLRKLMLDGRFIEPNRCKIAITEYRRDTNPARVFLEENYVECLEFEGVLCGEVYQSYVAWCGQNGYHPLNASNFGKEVKRTFPNVERQQRRIGRGFERVYGSLAVMEGSEVATV